MQKRTKLLATIAVSLSLLNTLQAREEDPDKNEHRETDRVFRDIQKETGASEHEKSAEREAWNLDKDSRAKEAQDKEKEYTGTHRPLERD